LMPAPEIATEEPLAPRMPFSELFAPTTTLPKFRLVGETDN